MQISLSQIIKFPSFFQEIQSLKLPIKLAFKLSQIKNELNFHIDFYWENLQKISLEYAQLDDEGFPRMTENGQGMLLKPDCVQECSQKIEELGALNIELPDSLKIDISYLEDLELTMQSFEAIMPFIKE